MANPKLEALKRIAKREGKQEVKNLLPEQEPSTFDKVIDYLDRPGAATRSAIQAYQMDEDPIEAFKTGFTSPSEKAPTGADIAETFSEQQNIQNPYALAALATIADVADPTSFVPGGVFRKAPKAMKAIGRGSKATEGIRDVSRLGKAGVEARNPAELMRVREILSNPEKYGHIPEVKKALEKTGSVGVTDIPVVGEKQSLIKAKPKAEDDEWTKVLQMINEAKNKQN